MHCETLVASFFFFFALLAVYLFILAGYLSLQIPGLEVSFLTPQTSIKPGALSLVLIILNQFFWDITWSFQYVKPSYIFFLLIFEYIFSLLLFYFFPWHTSYAHVVLLSFFKFFYFLTPLTHFSHPLHHHPLSPCLWQPPSVLCIYELGCFFVFFKIVYI